MKIYHNPRCSKSREGLAILEASKVNFETIQYLETPITKDELIHIIQLLNGKVNRQSLKHVLIFYQNPMYLLKVLIMFDCASRP